MSHRKSSPPLPPPPTPTNAAHMSVTSAVSSSASDLITVRVYRKTVDQAERAASTKGFVNDFVNNNNTERTNEQKLEYIQNDLLGSLCGIAAAT